MTLPPGRTHGRREDRSEATIVEAPGRPAGRAGRRNLDFSLIRQFNLGGTQRIELHAQAFNALNWFQWMQPNTVRSAATFGQVTTADDPRLLQFGIRYAF